MTTIASTTFTTLTTDKNNDVEGIFFVLLALVLYFTTLISMFYCFCSNIVQIEPYQLRNVIVFSSSSEDYLESHKYATDEVCSICLESKNMVRTDCSHIYCDECLKKLMNKSNTCPVCRAEF